MKNSLIIFDLDGTLIDSRYDLALAVNEMLESYRLAPLATEQIVSFVGDGIGNLVRRSLEARSGNRRVDAREAVARFEERYAAHLLDRTRLYPGVRETLPLLLPLRKVILSNKAVRFIGTILDGLGVREHFDALYGGDSFPVMKPDPAVVENILREQVARRESTMIVGDGPADIAAGKRAGIRTCAALYGFTAEEKLMRLAPDYWIREFVELSGLV